MGGQDGTGSCSILPIVDLPDIRSELRLLLLCARTRIGPEEARQIGDLLEEDIDWTDLIRCALHHHVTPLLARALADTCPGAVPAELREALSVHCEQARQHNEWLAEELLAILQSLGERGIVAVPFKGPMLAEQVYGDVGLRSFRDLDFLIQEEELPVALDLLRARDYDVDSSLTPVQWRGVHRALGQDSFVRRDGRSIVEPHWAFVPHKMALRIDYAGLRARCQPATLKGVSLLSFAPEDLALILAVHGAKELWWRLSWVCDVAELITAFPTLDWEVARERARRQGGGRMMLVAVVLAHRLLGARLPPPFVADLARDRTAARLVEDAIGRLLGSRTREAPGFNALSTYRRQTHEGWRAQTTYVLRTLCEPGPMHYEMVALPPSLSFGYHLVRAAHDYVLLPAWRLWRRLRPRG